MLGQRRRQPAMPVKARVLPSVKWLDPFVSCRSRRKDRLPCTRLMPEGKVRERIILSVVRKKRDRRDVAQSSLAPVAVIVQSRARSVAPPSAWSALVAVRDLLELNQAGINMRAGVSLL